MSMIINGVYEIIEEIGQGGGGIVYKAYHRNLEKYVVLKQIKDTALSTAETRNEVDLLKNLKHTYLPQVLDFIEYDGAVYTVMDYIDGSDLAKYQRGNPLNAKEIIRYSTQLCEAVKYLHEQKTPIIHGDIKPANIMVTSDGNICLIDFNISLLFDKNSVVTGFTRGFAAPEQVGWHGNGNIYKQKVKNGGVTEGTEFLSQTDRTELLHDKTEQLFLHNYGNTEKTEVLSPANTEIVLGDRSFEVTERTELLSSCFGSESGNCQDGTEKIFVQSDVGHKALTDLSSDIRLDNNLRNQSESSDYKVTVRSDVYSIGTVIYYMITGAVPSADFSAIKPLREFKPRVPEGLLIITEKAMNLNPSKRYASADEMLNALNNVMKLDRRYQTLRVQRTVVSVFCLAGLVLSALSVREGYRMHCQERQDKYDAFIYATESALAEQNYDEALKSADAALLYMPDKPEAYYEKIRILYSQDDYSDCIFYYSANERLLSESEFELKSNMYFMLANAFFETEDYNSAILNYNKALSLDSGYSDCYRDLAISYARVSQIDNASMILDRAISSSLSNEQIYLMKGEIEIARKNYIDAETCIKEAVEEAKDDYLLYRGLKLYVELCNMSDTGLGDPHYSAIHLLSGNQSRVSASYIGFIYEMLANQYTYLGRDENNKDYYIKAIDFYKKIMDNPAQRITACKNCYEIQYQLKDLEGCLQTLSLMQEANPNSYWIYMNYSYVQLEIQAETSIQARDYYEAFQNYLKAKELYEKETKNNMTDPNMQMLESYIERLDNDNWIKQEWRK